MSNTNFITNQQDIQRKPTNINNRFGLEARADTIDSVLARHGIEGRVTGGVVAPRSVQFTFATIATADEVKACAGDLALALTVPDVQVTRRGGHLVLEVRRDDAQPVKLLTMLHAINGTMLPACTSVLGMCDDGAPLLVRLSSKDIGHVLVTGPDGCGKSSLLRTMAVSLTVCNRPREVRLVLVGRELGDLARLPNVLEHVSDNMLANKMAGDLVKILLGRVEPCPRVVILINGLADILRGGNLDRLLNDGHASGVHIVASGAVSSVGFSTLVTGKGEAGDFEVIDQGKVVRFTAASITPAEVNQVVIGAMPKREPTRLHQAADIVAGVN